MKDIKKGDKVYIRDYPLGRPLNIEGEILGKVGRDSYNVLIKNGLLEGDIITYKYWKLYFVDMEEEVL